jgi:hypothetical protein
MHGGKPRQAHQQLGFRRNTLAQPINDLRTRRIAVKALVQDLEAGFAAASSVHGEERERSDCRALLFFRAVADDDERREHRRGNEWNMAGFPYGDAKRAALRSGAPPAGV